MAKSNEFTIDAVVEIPKGSRNKYEYDYEKKMIRYDRMLFSSVHYPSDYGFIPETLGLDGDPIDVLVLVTDPTFPGYLSEVNQHLMKEIEHFFAIYKELEKKKVGIEGWDSKEAAMRIIAEAQTRFQEKALAKTTE
jgi:inorganic pyrophosphatase